MMSVLLVLGGLALLFFGGEVLVRGAVNLAELFDVPKVLIALTVVALGTSAPEIFVSTVAVLEDAPNIALGNIIGSNISNIALVLGLTALIYPIHIDKHIVAIDGKVMLLFTIVTAIMCFLSPIGFMFGLILLTGFALYTYFLVWESRIDKKRQKELEATEEIFEDSDVSHLKLKGYLYTPAGIVLLVIGSKMLVTGASDLAMMLGVSDAVIAVTIVAVGSSAPELATSIISAFKKHADIALGNIVGSNILNIQVGLGVAAITGDIPVDPKFISFDIWLLLAITIALVFAIRRTDSIKRPLGIALFVTYIGYATWQFI